jgi:hypothetical protein
VTERLLAKDPQDRPADAQQTRTMLEAALTADEKTLASWMGRQDLVTEVATGGAESQQKGARLEVATRAAKDSTETVTQSSRFLWMLGAVGALLVIGVLVGGRGLFTRVPQETATSSLVEATSPPTEPRVAAVTALPLPSSIEETLTKKTESAPPPSQKVDAAPAPIAVAPQQKLSEPPLPRKETAHKPEAMAKSVAQPEKLAPVVPSPAPPKVEKEDPSIAGVYETIAATIVLSEPKSSASVVARLNSHTKVTVIAGVGDYVKVESRKGNLPGYVARQDLAPAPRESVTTVESAVSSFSSGGVSLERTDTILTSIRPLSGDAQLACRATDRAKLAALGRMRVMRLKPIRDRALEAMQQGRYQAAITAYEMLLQAGPDFIEVLMGLARAYHASHQPNSAIEYATQTIQRCALPEAYFIVASSFLQKGDKKRALAWLDVSLQGGFRERQRIEEHFSTLKNDPTYVALLQKIS